jgi:hypothetical protein
MEQQEQQQVELKLPAYLSKIIKLSEQNRQQKQGNIQFIN